MSDREDDGFNFDDDLDNLEDSDEELEDVAGKRMIRLKMNTMLINLVYRLEL
jgi:hypothetical protein